MPDATPIYGIPYPCPGETIDAGVFADFANAVDAAMTSSAATQLEAQTRPNAKIFRNGSDVLPAGVTTQLTFDFDYWDNDGMANVPAVDGLTIQTAGTYLVIGAATISSSGGTFTAADISLQINGSTHYIRRDNSDDLSDVSLYLSGLFDCVPGDLLTMHATKHGSAGGVADAANFSARLINRP